MVNRVGHKQRVEIYRLAIAASPASILVQLVGHHVAHKASAPRFGRQQITLFILKLGEAELQLAECFTTPYHRLCIDPLATPSLQSLLRTELYSRHFVFSIAHIGSAPGHLCTLNGTPLGGIWLRRVGQFLIGCQRKRCLSGGCSTLGHSLLGKKRHSATERKGKQTFHRFLPENSHQIHTFYTCK